MSATVRWCDTEALLSRWREHRDPAAREELVARFLPLARKLAGRYRASPEPVEDLVQVASLGLLRAIDRFDPARGTPFPAFAIPTILGELKHYYRDTAWSAHVPPSAQELALRVDRAARELAARSGRNAPIAELAEHLGVPIEDVVAGLDTATAHYSLSLAAPASAADDDEAETETLADSLGSEDVNYEMVEKALAVAAAVTELPAIERQALTLRLDYGMKQSEIARQLNCSPQQVSRLMRRARVRMQELVDPPVHASDVATRPGRVTRPG